MAMTIKPQAQPPSQQATVTTTLPIAVINKHNDLVYEALHAKLIADGYIMLDSAGISEPNKLASAKNELKSLLDDLFGTNPSAHFLEFRSAIKTLINDHPFYNLTDFLNKKIASMKKNKSSGWGGVAEWDITDLDKWIQEINVIAKNLPTLSSEIQASVGAYASDYLISKFNIKNITDIPGLDKWINDMDITNIDSTILDDVFSVLSSGSFANGPKGLMEAALFKTTLEKEPVFTSYVKEKISDLIFDAIKKDLKQSPINVKAPSNIEEAKNDKDHLGNFLDASRFDDRSKLIDILKKYGVNASNLSISDCSLVDQFGTDKSLTGPGLEMKLSYKIILTIGSETYTLLDLDPKGLIVQKKNEFFEAVKLAADKEHFSGRILSQDEIFTSSIFPDLKALEDSAITPVKVTEGALKNIFHIDFKLDDPQGGPSSDNLIKQLDKKINQGVTGLDELIYTVSYDNGHLSIKVYLNDDSSKNLLKTIKIKIEFNLEKAYEELLKNPITLGYAKTYIMTQEEKQLWNSMVGKTTSDIPMPLWFLRKFTNYGDVISKLQKNGIDIGHPSSKIKLNIFWNRQQVNPLGKIVLSDTDPDIDRFVKKILSMNTGSMAMHFGEEDISDEVTKFMNSLKNKDLVPTGQISTSTTNAQFTGFSFLKEFSNPTKAPIFKKEGVKVNAELVINPNNQADRHLKITVEYDIDNYESDDSKPASNQTKHIKFSYEISFQLATQADYDAGIEKLEEFASIAKKQVTTDEAKISIDKIVASFANSKTIKDAIQQNQLLKVRLSAMELEAEDLIKKAMENDIPQEYLKLLDSLKISEEERAWLLSNQELVTELINDGLNMQEVANLFASSSFRAEAEKLPLDKVATAVEKIYDTSKKSKYAFFGTGVGLGAASVGGAGIAFSSASAARKMKRMKKTKAKMKSRKLFIVVTSLLSMMMASTSVMSLVYFFISKGGF